MQIQIGRIGNVKRNIYYGFAQVAITQLFPFVTRTIIIYSFGVEFLGINSLFSSILNVLSLMELGFGTAVVFSMYKPVAENDIDQLCAYLAYYKKIYRSVGLSIMVSGLTIIPFIRYMVNSTILPSELNLVICYLIFLSDSVISYILYGYYSAIPIAFQRRDILSRIDLCAMGLKCIVQIMALSLANSFYGYLFVIPGTTIVKNLMTALVVRYKYPDIICRGKLNDQQIIELKKRVRGILISKVTGISRNGIDSICISSFIGLAILGIYNNYLYIMSGIIAFSSMLRSAMIASVGNSIVVENREKNYDDMRIIDGIYMTISGWATVCMFCLYQPFIFVWIGSDMLLEYPMVIGICLYFYILKNGDIQWLYQEGAGLWYENRFIMLGEALLNCFLNILLCKNMGVLGIILATVISVFITNVILCPRLLFKMYFGISRLKKYWIDHMLYTCTMVLSAVACCFLCSCIFPLSMLVGRIVVNSVLCLVGRLLLCTLFTFMIVWIIWHRSERYKRAKAWIKRVMMA